MKANRPILLLIPLTLSCWNCFIS